MYCKRLAILPLVLAAAAVMAGPPPSALHTADEFSALVRDNPLVVGGRMGSATTTGEVQAVTSAWIRVAGVLKNELPLQVTAGKTRIELELNANNAYWVTADVKYEKGQTGVWILDAEAVGGKLVPAGIVAHFVMAESELSAQAPPEKNVAPLEQWGATGGETGFWAVTKRPEAGVYTADGKLVQKVKAGTLVEIVAIKGSASGDIAVCRIIENRRRGPEQVVLVSDINIQPGTLEKVARNRYELCRKEALIQAEIEGTRELLVASNEVVVAYTAAKSAHADYWANVKDLESKRESATRARRQKYADELRKLKGEDIILADRLTAARAGYEQWQRDGGASKVTSPELEQLQRDLNEVRVLLGGKSGGN